MTTEPIIYFPLTERQRELAEVAQIDPSFVELEEIRELASIVLLQQHRDETAACVADWWIDGWTGSRPEDRSYDDDDDEW